jgi:archaellum component FlaC
MVVSKYFENINIKMDDTLKQVPKLKYVASIITEDINCNELKAQI